MSLTGTRLELDVAAGSSTCACCQLVWQEPRDTIACSTMPQLSQCLAQSPCPVYVCVTISHWASWLIRSLKPTPGVQWEREQQLWSFGGRAAKLKEWRVDLGSDTHMRSPGTGEGGGGGESGIRVKPGFPLSCQVHMYSHEHRNASSNE